MDDSLHATIMSETTLYAILFFGTFPALWPLARWLDRVWPNPSEPNTTARASKAKGEKSGGSHYQH
jgi:hypothetical protein